MPCTANSSVTSGCDRAMRHNNLSSKQRHEILLQLRPHDARRSALLQGLRAKLRREALSAHAREPARSPGLLSMRQSRAVYAAAKDPDEFATPCHRRPAWSRASALLLIPLPSDCGIADARSPESTDLYWDAPRLSLVAVVQAPGLVSGNDPFVLGEEQEEAR